MPLDRARTLFLSINPEQAQVPGRLGSFFDDFNIDEFTLIVWNAAMLWTEWINRPSPQQGPLEKISAFKVAYEAKIKTVLRWVSDGLVLCILISKIDPLGMAEDINSWIPFDRIKLQPSSGQLVEPSSNFKDMFASYSNLIQYNFVLEGNGMIPLFQAATTLRQRARTVAGVFRVGRGVIVFIPPPRIWDDAYFLAIAKLPEQLPQGDDLPEWSNKYRSGAEQKAVAVVETLQAQALALSVKIEKNELIVSAETKWKVLYTGSDDSLVEQVCRALNELGLQVVKGPHTRADLLVWDGERLAAAEVKGLEGAAKEADLRQVQTWVAEVNLALAVGSEGRKGNPDLIQYAEKLTELGLDVSAPIPDMECHGLMIIGTFRKMPLDTRPSDSFPSPVARLIARSNAYALTGLDLYCLLQETRAMPNLKQEITNKLMTAVGVVVQQDWRQFIRVV